MVGIIGLERGLTGDGEMRVGMWVYGAASLAFVLGRDAHCEQRHRLPFPLEQPSWRSTENAPRFGNRGSVFARDTGDDAIPAVTPTMVDEPRYRRYPAASLIPFRHHPGLV